MTIYSAQKNAYGNVIVCKGTDERASYKIMAKGTYQQMLQLKITELKPS